MIKRFELFVAFRYLMAKRKQAVISVITVISVVGVASGVMALVVGLAVTTGLRNTLQRSFVAATAHVMVMEKQPQFGIEQWQTKIEPLKKLQGVTQASPSLYATVVFNGANPVFGFLRGILPPDRAKPPEMLLHPREGSFKNWDAAQGGVDPIILGSHVADSIGVKVGNIVKVLSLQGAATPMGSRPAEFRFRVIAIFESGFYPLDSAWGFASLEATQKILSVDDVVNSLDMTLDDIYRAPEVAASAVKVIPPELGATTWIEQNRNIFGALKMERTVAAITIGLIQMVAGLNILISLIMMVMEKHRDIAILMSLGTRRSQIRNIFMLQGMLIGIVGTTIGLAVGYAICFFANKGEWLQLDEAVYMMRFVPLEPRLADALWIGGAALVVSFLATLYPARSATKIAPAEALRYE